MNIPTRVDTLTDIVNHERQDAFLNIMCEITWKVKIHSGAYELSDRLRGSYYLGNMNPPRSIDKNNVVLCNKLTTYPDARGFFSVNLPFITINRIKLSVPLNNPSTIIIHDDMLSNCSSSIFPMLAMKYGGISMIINYWVANIDKHTINILPDAIKGINPSAISSNNIVSYLDAGGKAVKPYV